MERPGPDMDKVREAMREHDQRVEEDPAEPAQDEPEQDEDEDEDDDA